MRTYRRILVPMDGSATANKALVAALQIARDGGGRVLLVHAVDELAYLTGFESSADVLTIVRQAGERVLADAAQIATAAGVEADMRFIDEPGRRLGESIAKEALDWQADLIAVGTHGRRGVARVLLGSGAEQIIRSAPVPVLVIRGD